MESIEKFNGDNKFHMIGKSEIDIEQIISVAKMFDQYNEDKSGFMDINDAYRFMKETKNYQVTNGGELACFHLFQKWDID